jgi:hypothetical protein
VGICLEPSALNAPAFKRTCPKSVLAVPGCTFPTENFLVFFVRWAADPLPAIYPVAGLVTAGFYRWLGTWRRVALRLVTRLRS